MGNFSAVLVVLAAYLLPLLSPVVRRNAGVLGVVWLTITAHVAIGFYNAFVAPISDTWGDQFGFHRNASGPFEALKEPYTYLLWFCYRIFGSSFWFGSMLSVLAYVLSLFPLLDLLRRLGQEKAGLIAVLLYGLLPGPLAHRVVPIRESYQGLCFVSIAWSLVSMRRDGPTPWNGIVLGLSMFCLSMLHHSMPIFVAGVFVVGLPWALGRHRALAPLLILGALFVSLLGYKLNVLAARQTVSVEALQKGSLIDYAAVYREGIATARSDYGVKLETKTPFEFVASLFAILFLYFFAPLPWQATSMLDYYAMLEVALRTFLLIGAFRFCIDSNSEEAVQARLVLGLCLVLEGMWAIGTTNWGQAIRHHIPAFGGIVVLGSAYWGQYTRSGYLERLYQRRQERYDQEDDQELRSHQQSPTSIS